MSEHTIPIESRTVALAAASTRSGPPEPEELASDAIAELEGAVEELNQVLALLENGGKG